MDASDGPPVSITLGQQRRILAKSARDAELVTGPVWSKLLQCQRFVHGWLTFAIYRRPMNHVLLVEDDPDLREVLGVAFSTINGWDVTSAATTAAALELLACSTPGLVLCDLHLGDGLATGVMTQAVHQGIPTLVLTASRVNGSVESLMPDGIAGVLEKPIDPHALCELGRDLTGSSWTPNPSAASVFARDETAVASFMVHRRPRVAREAMTLLGGDEELTRTELHRLVGRLATYGLHDSAEALRDAEESMAIGRAAGDSSVHDSIVLARERLVEFVSRG